MRLSGWLLSIAALGAALGAASDNALAQTWRAGTLQEPAESPSDGPPLPPSSDNGPSTRSAPSTRGGAAAPAPTYGPAHAPGYQPGSTHYSPPHGPQPWETPVHEPAWNGHPCWTDWGCTSFLSVWARFDYLHWWRQGQNFPPLVTSGGNGTTADPNTQILFGGNEIESAGHPGGRIDLGVWIDDCQQWGIGVRAFALSDAPNEFFRQSGGTANDPILGRPFFDAAGNPQVSVIAGPDVLGVRAAGNVAISTSSDLAGGDVYFRHLMWSCGSSRLDFLGGYQAAQIEDSIAIRTVRFRPGTTAFNVTDRFETENTYNAGTVGFLWQENRGCFTLDAMVKLGLGQMEEQVRIAGTSNGAQPNAGLLAQRTNSGTFTDSEFALSPEVAANMSWQVIDHVSVTAGYSFIYWSKVAQAGDQIDTTLDLAQGPNATRPQFNLSTSDFWAHGLNLGVAITY